MSQAVIKSDESFLKETESFIFILCRALIDSETKEYIGYFLPTAETRAKRTREENDEEDADDTYDFKLIREYNWNRKDKTMSGFEENYFLSVRDDSIVYNELETRSRNVICLSIIRILLDVVFLCRVRLSKRIPVTGRSKVANLRLIQRYREFNDNEEKTQVCLKKISIEFYMFFSREND